MDSVRIDLPFDKKKISLDMAKRYSFMYIKKWENDQENSLTAVTVSRDLKDCIMYIHYAKLFAPRDLIDLNQTKEKSI